LIRCDDVDKILVRDEHPPTAVSFNAEFVEYLGRVFGILGLAGPMFELLPVLADDVTARETPDWYHHG
jgi:hypothetical protein